MNIRKELETLEEVIFNVINNELWLRFLSSIFMILGLYLIFYFGILAALISLVILNFLLMYELKNILKKKKFILIF